MRWVGLLGAVAIGARIAFAINCDVGDAIQAVYDGDGQFKGATIAAIDLAATPQTEVTVDWDDLSPSYRLVSLANTRKSGSVCVPPADALQTFAAVAGQTFDLRVTGPSLAEAARVLIAGQAEVCGSLSATQDPAVSAEPGVPLGTVDLQFFGVVVDTAASYKVCFWSGQSVGGLGEYDLASYATTLGPLVVAATTITATTTTTWVVPFSRRRGTSYESTSLKVRGSEGAFYEGLTANPAAWNVHLPGGEERSCRRCRSYRVPEVEGKSNHRRETNSLSGRLVAQPPEEGNATAVGASLGFGCEAAGAPAPPAATMVLMVARGLCTFEAKARAAHARGFRGLLVADSAAAAAAARLPDMAAAGGADAEATMPLPAWVLPSVDGADIRALAGSDPVVSVEVVDLVRQPRLSSGLSDAYGVRNYVVQ